MASHDEDQSTAAINRTSDGDNRDNRNLLGEPSPGTLNRDIGARAPPTSGSTTDASSSSPHNDTQTSTQNAGDNTGIRQRVVGNANPAVPAPEDPLEPRPGETPQERRRRRLQRDREQLLSLINANPVACICILIAASFVVVGVGYFLYELHLAYKYSSIIHKLHVSSLKDGYGFPSSFSSSQKGNSKVPSPSPSSSTPSGVESKKLPMLDAETEMYANQLQSVLSGLKRTLDRIDPTTNSTTLIAGLVQLKPADAETSKTPPGFTTEVHPDDAKISSAQGTSPNQDLYSFLTKGPSKRAEVIADKTSLNQHTEEESFAQAKPQQAFPDYLRDLKTSLEAETKKAQDKLDDWIEKHRHEYANEEDWKEALELKKAKEEDYNRFLDAMFYVAEELENDYSESGLGALDNTNEEESVSLAKLLEILAKTAKSSDDDNHASINDVSGDTSKIKKFGLGEKKAEDDWAYEMWDEDEEDDDWDDKAEKERAEPQFA